MTIDEKRSTVRAYCGHTGCMVCPLRGKKWSEYCLTGGLLIETASEDELDRALELFGHKEAVNHPSHYNQGKFECIDVMVDVFGKTAAQEFCLLNAFKYIWRSDQKNGSEDIKKAVWYLNKFLELESGSNDSD